MAPQLQTVEAALHRLYIGASGTSLRKEDRKKALEVHAILEEIERMLCPRRQRPAPLTLVDAAAGKAYVGLLAAELLLGPRQWQGHVMLIEHDQRQAEACRRAAAGLSVPGMRFTVVESDVANADVWPATPELVVGLHACGPASDAIIERTVASRAAHLLLVPCCTSKQVAASALAVRRADALGLPRHAEVRRKFVEAFVAAERTLRLEAAGYETTVVAFVPPTVSGHHLLWRSRRVSENGRMRQAVADLRRLRGD